MWKRLKSELFTKKVDKKPLYDYYTTRQCKNQVRFYFSGRKKHKNFLPFFVDNKQKKNSQIESSVKKYIEFYKILWFSQHFTAISWVWHIPTAFTVVKNPTFIPAVQVVKNQMCYLCSSFLNSCTKSVLFLQHFV